MRETRLGSCVEAQYHTYTTMNILALSKSNIIISVIAVKTTCTSSSAYLHGNVLIESLVSLAILASETRWMHH